MAFLVTKVLLALILPPACLIILLLAGLLLLRKRPGLGGTCLFFGISLLYLLSLPVASDMLVRPLESYARPFDGNAKAATAIVVLGGGVLERTWVPAPPELTAATLARVVAGVEFSRKLRLPLVVSGGSGAIDGSTVNEADAMANQALRLGIAPKDIVIENRSRNTLENARFVRELLQERTIVLVTSASHMRRAAAFFRKQGFTVIPAPTGYCSGSRPASWTNLLPRAGSLDASARAIAEQASYGWYSLRGDL